jgi:hypothetical protein
MISAVSGMGGMGKINEAIALLNQLCPDKTHDSELTAKLAGQCGRLPLVLTIVGELTLGSLLTLVKLEQDLERSVCDC